MIKNEQTSLLSSIEKYHALKIREYRDKLKDTICYC